MMKGWQKNIDNFGYIERKQFGKVSEGKPTGTIYRGQHYFVRIDESNNKGHSKGSSYARGGRDREETPEYKPKE
jgi:hypothetical protein